MPSWHDESPVQCSPAQRPISVTQNGRNGSLTKCEIRLTSKAVPIPFDTPTRPSSSGRSPVYIFSPRSLAIPTRELPPSMPTYCQIRKGRARLVVGFATGAKPAECEAKRRWRGNSTAMVSERSPGNHCTSGPHMLFCAMKQPDSGNTMIDWISANLEWVFSGVGVFVLAGLTRWLTSRSGDRQPLQKQQGGRNSVNVQAAGDVKIGDVSVSQEDKK